MPRRSEIRNWDVVDIRKLAELAHENGLPLVMDNTVATAYLVCPLELGADIVVNSTSKYVNGNSDAISGVITDSGNFKWDKEKYPGMKEYAKFGKFAFTAKLRNGLFRNTGACMAPQTAFYNMLGLETLGLRMERACFNARKVIRVFDAVSGYQVIIRACQTAHGTRLQKKLWNMAMARYLRSGSEAKNVLSRL